MAERGAGRGQHGWDRDRVGRPRGLGFEPHADFDAAADHLGRWTGPSAITFGRDGKPLYVEGPYDNTSAILKTLERTVGRDSFHFTAALA